MDWGLIWRILAGASVPLVTQQSNCISVYNSGWREVKEQQQHCETSSTDSLSEWKLTRWVVRGWVPTSPSRHQHPSGAGSPLDARGKHPDPPRHLSSVRPLLASPCGAASFQLPGTARCPHPDLPRELDAAWHHTHRRHCCGSRGPAAAAPGAVPAAGHLSGRSGARECGWPHAVEKESAKLGPANESSSSQLLRTASQCPSCCQKNTGQLLCHNLIAALFTRNVNEPDPQEERKHSQPTFKGGGLPQKSQFGHFSKSLGIQTPGKQH